MNDRLQSWLQVELATPQQYADLNRKATACRWGLALICLGWLHLAVFGTCYYLTIVADYHEAPAYLSLWIGELIGMGAIFYLCGLGAERGWKRNPLELFIRRVWIAYFLLAFNLGSMNTLRGHVMFELFPAMASLASFAFIMLSIVVHWRFFLAVLVMFASGLIMAANFWHAFLIFALAWWLVLNGIGIELWWRAHKKMDVDLSNPANESGSVENQPEFVNRM